MPGQTLCHSTSHTVIARRLSPAVLLSACLASITISRPNLHKSGQPTYPGVVRLSPYKFLRNKLLPGHRLLCTRRLAAERTTTCLFSCKTLLGQVEIRDWQMTCTLVGLPSMEKLGHALTGQHQAITVCIGSNVRELYVSDPHSTYLPAGPVPGAAV